MSTSPESTKLNKYYIHSFIGVAIMIIFALLPTFGPLTPIGMRVIGIFIGMCYLWSTVGMLWPSLLGIAALIMSGYAPVADVLKMTFGVDAVWVSIFGMGIMAAIEQAGLNDHIVAAFLGNKVINGRPWVFCMIFSLAVSVFCSCINSFVGYFLFWSICGNLAKRFGYKMGDKFIVLMIIGVGAIGHMSTNLLPFRGMPMVLLSSVKNMADIQISNASYMAISIPLQVAFILTYVGMMKFIFRCDVSAIANISSEDFRKELDPLNKKQKFLLGYLVFFILILMLPGILPKTSFIGVALNNLSTVGIMMLLLAFLCFFHIDGEPLLPFQKISGTIYWEMPFLLAAAMGLSSALVADSTGVKTLLSQILVPIFVGKSDLVFLVIFTLMAIILTNLCNNLVIDFLFAPMAVTYAAQSTINLPATITLLTYAVLIAFLIPASSATVGMIMTNPLIDPKKYIRYSLPVIGVLTLTLLVVGIPLCTLFY
ncbi:MAG: hypothetical protein UDB11_06755 [Peptococcaceae bacterium]|nr:hypothetical protein [Peptococcaceae bacterium]